MTYLRLPVEILWTGLVTDKYLYCRPYAIRFRNPVLLSGTRILGRLAGHSHKL